MVLFKQALGVECSKTIFIPVSFAEGVRPTQSQSQPPYNLYLNRLTISPTNYLSA